MNNQVPKNNSPGPTANSVLIGPSELELAMYNQAHETRRKWESYIWQWGMVVTALVSFTAVLLVSSTATSIEIILPKDTPLQVLLLRKAILVLLSLFLLSIAFNVYRARQLMKKLDKTITKFHQMHNSLDFPVVPCELDQNSRITVWFLSSTRYSVVAHFLTFLVFFILAIYEVFWQ